MRRFFAITAIVALSLSIGLPVWATACTTMDKDKMPMCHRAAAHHHHHCETMAGQQDQPAAGDAESAFKGLSDECPMQCCMQLQIGNGTAVLAISFQPELVVAEYRVDSPPIAFISSGFSSHTDRGPPSL